MSDRGFGHNKIDFVFIFVSRLINGHSRVRVPGYAACGYDPRPDLGRRSALPSLAPLVKGGEQSTPFSSLGHA